MDNRSRLLIVGAFCCVALTASPLLFGQSKSDGSVQALVELLNDKSPDVLARAQRQYAALPKTGDAAAIGARALALLLARSRDFDRAVAVIVSRPDQERFSLPLLRLRLWIELERGNLDTVLRVLPAIQEKVLDTKQDLEERRATMRMLGAVAAILPAEARAKFDVHAVEGAIKIGTSTEGLKLAQEFRSAKDHVGDQSKIVADLIGAGAANAGGIAKTLEEAQMNWQQAGDKLRTARAELPQTTKQSALATQELPRQKFVMERNIVVLENSNEAPGRPFPPVRPTGEPSKPTEPRKPSSDSDSAKKEYDREMDQYRSDLAAYPREKAEYDRKVREYENELANFPRRMAEWEQKNRDWPMLKSNYIADVRQKLADAITNEKALRDRISELKKNVIPDSEKETRLVDLRVQLLKRLTNLAPDADQNRLVFRSSNYDLLSLHHEELRLQRAVK